MSKSLKSQTIDEEFYKLPMMVRYNDVWYYCEIRYDNTNDVFGGWLIVYTDTNGSSLYGIWNASGYILSECINDAVEELNKIEGLIWGNTFENE